MIDLTPLDVRNKRGDFRRGLRGYEPQEVDAFLETVADRMDILVRENMALRERTEDLKIRVDRQDSRENAVQEALVSAQALREEIRAQAQREAELQLREADQEAERRRADSEHLAERVREEIERTLAEGRRDLEELHRSRSRFLRAYRSLLEREMDVVEMEEERRKADDLDVDLDDLRIFRGGQGGQGEIGAAVAAEHAEPAAEAEAVGDPERSPDSASPMAGETDGEAGSDGTDDASSADASPAIDISTEREARLPDADGQRDASPAPDPFRHG
jgi:cell division initiation protein